MEVNSFAEQTRIAKEIINEVFNCFGQADLYKSKLELLKKEKWTLIGIVIFLFGIIITTMTLAGIPQTIYEFIECLFFSLAIDISAIVLPWYMKKKNKVKSKEYEEIMEYNLNRGNKILNSNIEHLSFLPQKYWYPVAIDYICELAQTNRVDNVNDALNMLDEQIHRWNMEKMQNQIQIKVEEQTRIMRNIEINTTVSAFADLLR